MMIPIPVYQETYLQVCYSKPIWHDLPVYFPTLVLEITSVISKCLNEVINSMLLHLKQEITFIVLHVLKQNLIQ